MRLLSKREKAMLYLLAVLAIAAGLVLLVILPAQKRAEELDEQIIAAQSQTDSMRILISQVEGMQEEIAEYEANIEVEKEFFLPVMSSNDLDEYITGLLQSHGLIAQSLAISADGGQTETDMLQIYQINIVARGQISQFVSLAETVKNTDGVRIMALSLVQEKTPQPRTVVAAPAATPAGRRDKRSTPTPEPTPSPTPTPYDPIYTMNVVFEVIEYNEAAEPDAAELPEEEESGEAPETDLAE